ncbi:hypothetical protein HCA63_17000 [Listeria booriae]|uniref:hypothetical protein n=1 Tax=Listeria booriae TaxID=1552123 RepID=UPI001624B49E|nr:hypothetical protein [Listeria booriae]MBC1890057.1 hypothetical protein [Listeria booriae]
MEIRHFDTGQEMNQALGDEIIDNIKKVLGVTEFTEEEFTVITPFNDNQAIIAKRVIEANGVVNLQISVTNSLWIKPHRDGVLDIYQADKEPIS